MNASSETLGKWILVDYLRTDQPGLLSIGGTGYEGASVRKNLDARGRELLLDRIRVVADTAIPIKDTVEYRGERYCILVEPIVAPASSNLVAVRAIHHPLGQDAPPPPLVGVFEWLVWEDGRIETIWNDDTFALYGVPRKGSSSPTNDMNQWLNTFVAPEDRPRVKLAIDAALKESSGKRVFLYYRIITGPGSAAPGTRNVAVVAVTSPHPHLPMHYCLGLTWELASPATDPAPQFADVGGLMRACFELSTESVLAAVDIRRWQTFMTSPNWASSGLQEPAYGALSSVVHPADFGLFCESVQAPGMEPVRVRLLHASGSYVPYEITSSSGPENPRKAEYVVCKIKALPELS